MINSRDKGKREELELVKIFKELGFSAWRSQQYKGHKDAADVIVNELPDHYIEMKARKQLNIYEWFEKAQEEAEDKTVLLVIKKPYKGHLVIMDLHDFLHEKMLSMGMSPPSNRVERDAYTDKLEDKSFRKEDDGTTN